MHSQMRTCLLTRTHDDLQAPTSRCNMHQHGHQSACSACCLFMIFAKAFLVRSMTMHAAEMLCVCVCRPL